jgi:hypothetical protein
MGDLSLLFPLYYVVAMVLEVVHYFQGGHKRAAPTLIVLFYLYFRTTAVTTPAILSSFLGLIGL